MSACPSCRRPAPHAARALPSRAGQLLPWLGLVAAFVASCLLPVRAADQPWELYYSLYPEWKSTAFGTPSTRGTTVGTLGTLRNDRIVLTADVAAKPQVEEPAWSNSYVGLRGNWQRAPWTWGYDLQGLVNFTGRAANNFRARDAFVWVEHAQFGRLTWGQLDSQYKEVGDPVRMFSIASSNIVSNARLQSGAGWRGRGANSFNNRADRMWAWVSPKLAGFSLGASSSDQPADTVPGVRSGLQALTLQWIGGPWMTALGWEQHRNWMALSGFDPSLQPAATSILNAPATARSRDDALRWSWSYKQGAWRFGGDVAELRYRESDSLGLAGKFRSHRFTTAQVSGEWRLHPRLALGASWVQAGAGRCTLSGGVACDTTGMGARQFNGGLLLRVDEVFSVFAIGTLVHNEPGASYLSAPQGGIAKALAVGLRASLR